MAIASLRSILALKPPFTHSCAAPLPANSPCRMIDLPKIAAVTAPTPMMMGVAMSKSLDISANFYCVVTRKHVMKVYQWTLTTSPSKQFSPKIKYFRVISCREPLADTVILENTVHIQA